MIQPAVVATLAGDQGLADLGAPLPLDRLVPGDGDWEVEIGFGKGKYLLRRCGEDPGRRFLGIELAVIAWVRWRNESGGRKAPGGEPTQQPSTSM